VVGLDFAGVAEFFEAGGDGGFVDHNGLFVEVFKCGVHLVRLGSDGEGAPSEEEEGTEEASAVMGEYVGDAEGLDAPFEEGWNVGIGNQLINTGVDGGWLFGDAAVACVGLGFR